MTTADDIAEYWMMALEEFNEDGDVFDTEDIEFEFEDVEISEDLLAKLFTKSSPSKLKTNLTTFFMFPLLISAL